MIVAALFLTGAAFFVLHFSGNARQLFSDWILEGETSFLLIAILVTAIAVVFAACFGAMQKGSYIRLKGRGFSLDEALVRSATVAFWEEELPDEPLPSEVYCSGGKIEVITTDLKEDLEEIEGRLGFFLSNQLGYDREFYITLTRR